MYIILVGPAGEVRKTTAMGFGIQILEHLLNLKKGPDAVTQQALVTDLVEGDDTSIYLTVTELSDLMMKSEKEMYEFLTSMFDGKSSYKSATIGRGVEFANRPCINMIAATTPEWIAGNMPEEVIGGGFASRCIFLFEDKSRFKKLFYDDISTPNNDATLLSDLISDLRHISEAIEGEFSIDPDAKSYMEEWYQGTTIPRGSRLASYYARKPTHVLKIAQLLHIAYSDELVLQKVDITDAIAILDRVEIKMKEVFEGVGKNEYILDARGIVNYITLHGRIKRSELLRQFENVATHYKLEELIGGLLASLKIKADIRDDDTYYIIPQPKKE